MTMDDYTFMRFAPSEQELLLKVLAPKVNFGTRICSENVQEHNTHFLDPRTIDWSPNVKLFDNERYYLIKRVPKSTSGQNADRTGDSGFWRVAQTKPIKDSNNGVVGFMNHLNFYAPLKGSEKTHWIMNEYVLPATDSTSFQEWSVCRVKDSTAPKIAPLPRTTIAPLPRTIMAPLPPPLPTTPPQPAPSISRSQRDESVQEQQMAVEDPFRDIMCLLDEPQHVEEEDFAKKLCSWFSRFNGYEARFLPDFEPPLQDDDPVVQSPRRKKPRQ